jgi:hypothetical protein
VTSILAASEGTMPQSAAALPVAQDAVRCHRGREIPAAPVHEGVADGVDAAVEPVQPPAGHAVPDHRVRQPDLSKVVPAHHTVLATGELGEADIRGRLWVHTTH